MIANITYGGNIYSLIEYNERKVSEGIASRIRVENFLTEHKSEFLGRFLDMVKETTIEEFTFHCSLSLPIGENISDEKFASIAGDYMNGLGMENQPYIVYRHRDRSHEHVHIVTVLVDDNGKRIDRYYQFNRSEDLCAELETQYDLTPVDHTGKSKKRELAQREQLTLNKQGVRSEIARVSRYIKENYLVTNINELRKVYAHHGVNVKAVDLSIYGKSSEFGLVYLLQEEGAEVMPIRSSEIYHDVTWSGWNKHFEKNISKKDKLTGGPVIETKVGKVLAGYEGITFKDFKDILYSENIIVIYDVNASGIYGVSFINNETGAIYKGSDLNLSISSLKKKGVGTDLTTNNLVYGLQNFVAKQLYYDLYRRHFQASHQRQSDFIINFLTEEAIFNGILDHPDFSKHLTQLPELQRQEFALWVTKFIQDKHDRLPALQTKEDASKRTSENRDSNSDDNTFRGDKQRAPGTKEERALLSTALSALTGDHKGVWQRRSHIIQYKLTPELLFPYVKMLPEFRDRGDRELLQLCREYVSYQKGRIIEIKANEALNRLFSLQYRPYYNSLLINSGGDFRNMLSQLDVTPIINTIASSNDFSNLKNNTQFGQEITVERLSSLCSFIVEKDIEKLQDNFIMLYVKGRLEEFTSRARELEDKNVPHDEFLARIYEMDLFTAFSQDSSLNGGLTINAENIKYIQEAIEVYKDTIFTQRFESLRGRIINEAYANVISDHSEKINESSFIAEQLSSELLLSAIYKHESYPEILEMGKQMKAKGQLEDVVKDFVEYKSKMIHFVYISEKNSEYKRLFYKEQSARNVSREIACTAILNAKDLRSFIDLAIDREQPSFLDKISHEDLSGAIVSESERFIQKERLNAPYYAMMQVTSTELSRSYMELRKRPEYNGVGEGDFINRYLSSELLTAAISGNQSFTQAYTEIQARYPNSDNRFMQNIVNNSVENFIAYKNDNIATIYLNEAYNKFIYDNKPIWGSKSSIIKHALSSESLFAYAIQESFLKNMPAEELSGLCSAFITGKKEKLFTIMADEAITRLFNMAYRSEFDAAIVESRGNVNVIENRIDISSIVNNISKSDAFAELQRNTEYGMAVNPDRLKTLSSFIYEQDLASLRSDYLAGYIPVLLSSAFQSYKALPAFANIPVDVIHAKFLSENLLKICIDHGALDQSDGDPTKDRISSLIDEYISNSKEKISQMTLVRIVTESYHSLLSQLPQNTHRESVFIGSGLHSSSLISRILQHKDFDRLRSSVDDGAVNNYVDRFITHKQQTQHEIYIAEALRHFRSSFYTTLREQGISREKACTRNLSVETVTNFVLRHIEQEKPVFFSSPANLDVDVQTSSSRFYVRELQNAPVYAVQELVSTSLKEIYSTIRSTNLSQGISESSTINLLKSETIRLMLLSNNEFRSQYADIISRYPNTDSRKLETIIAYQIDNYVSYKQSRVNDIKQREMEYESKNTKSELINTAISGAEELTGTMGAPSKGKKLPKRKKKRKP